MRPSQFIIAAALLSVSGCVGLGARSASPSALAFEAQNVLLPISFNQTKAITEMVVVKDPILEALLNQIPDSPDIVIAQARLDEARARLTAARAGLFPTLTGTASVLGTSADDSVGVTSGAIGGNLQVPIDLFGANRGRVGATRARAEEAAYNKDRATALTRATLSQLYIALRTAQAQIAVTQANIVSATDSLSLATTRQRAGLETGLAVAQATSNRDAIAARLPAFQQSEIAARLGLEALLGKLPETLSAQVGPVKPIPRFDISRADLAPDQWLATRADLLAGQRRLEAAGLEAKAARRDRYPSLSLSAVVNQNEASRGVTGLAGSASANLLLTLFDFGRLDAVARAAGANAQAQAALYRQLVINAVADVETQASRVARGNAAISANDANIASAQDQAQLARVRYTSGLSGFLEVLTAERAVYEAQSAGVVATGETALGEVALNLALGF